MAITKTESGATVFTESGVTVYQALAVKHGLKACKIGMRVNRAYTPTNLMAMVSKITGNKHKRGDYDGAIASVDAWVEQQRDLDHVMRHFESCYAGCGVAVSSDGSVRVLYPDSRVELQFTLAPGDPALSPWRAYVCDNGDRLEIMQGPESGQ